ncbi:MAG TPA: YdeI/OmpD-associated family protein [Ilumatobacter sp.]
MNAEVDAYVDRSQRWPLEMAALRAILLESGLTEKIAWGKPCYGHDGRHIAIMQEMKGFLALMFFKGALLPDPEGVLEAQGPNSRSARRIGFRSVADVTRSARAVAALVDAAIAVERAGLTVGPPPPPVLVDELQRRLDGDPALRAAFEALTPGRRREYHLYIAGAKQAATRTARVDRCTPRILAGAGLRDR